MRESGSGQDKGNYEKKTESIRNKVLIWSRRWAN